MNSELAIDLIQGTDEWLQARCGSLGASSVADATAKTKSGWGASRANVMARLLVERLTGSPQNTYTNAAMQWGTETEPQARAAYELIMDAEVLEVGLCMHPDIDGSHASPDGLVGDLGLLEIKCPQTATHIDTLLGKAIDGKYIKQMQWQMACTNREWCDFVSFDPRLPPDLQFFCQRVERDNKLIAELEDQVCEFLKELESKLVRLQEDCSS